MNIHSDIYISSGLVVLSASELAEKIRSRQVTSLDVVQAHLDHIRKHNPAINAIVALDEESALLQAREADEAMARGNSCGPLHGVPVTVKDNMAVKGFKTTHGYTPTVNYRPAYDATVVDRLRKEGAIILGKTNLSSLAKDYQTFNPIFGVTSNPWDVSRTPGGSTGGGAAAVAAGLSPLEIGNDLGGSLRIPAHFCGIYGLKPTERLVPRTGIIPGLPKNVRQSLRHLTCVGPLARSIEDLKLCMGIISGPDGTDTDVPPVSILDHSLSKNPGDIRIAWADVFPGVPVSAEIQAALKQLAGQLSRAGYNVVKTLPVDFDFMLAWQTWGRIMDIEFAANMPSPLFDRILLFTLGRFMERKNPLMQVVYPATYKKYTTELWQREKLISRMDRFMSDYDVFLCPVHTTTAFKHIHPDGYFGPYPVYRQNFPVDGHQLNYWVANASYTSIFNLTGHPVGVMPIGHTDGELPVGVQVVGKRWRDMELLQIMEQMDGVVKAYRRPPGF